MDFLKRFWIWFLITAVIAAFSFGIGLFVGTGLGDLNAEIDFCSDSTSSRFIANYEARKQACR
ncbi:hypothetical protein TRM7557_01390 [Tritonibacter multivorans]|uniref:Uncharacterized protein n=1 Tax=Tritonibacter multivorans TaxID=928856 RepID=A0A0P1GSA4_9RHOB|nr:hypothetical protein TRM7557_01390 [Tritonibacter multivorans]SFD32593.1 hypothetical protein SAMN04488049_11147 [Tritonibacter multivorans]